MTVKSIKPNVSFSLFTASKQVQFIQTLKRIRFSGHLILTSPDQQKWLFFLCDGHLMYAMGGTHPVRRWLRNIATHSPQLTLDRLTIQRDLSEFNQANCQTSWQYYLLSLWVKQQKITPEQTKNLIQSVITEVLFDIAHAKQTTYQIKQDNTLSTQLPVVDVEMAIAQTDKLWQAWHHDLVAEYSPNLAPVIRQPKALEARTSEAVYHLLSKLLDGKHTLRDVAVQMKRDVLQVTRSLLPYIRWGLVELISIPDLPSPVKQESSENPSTTTQSTQPLIACVDDSPLVCHTMEKLLTASGYRSLVIDDGLRAIALVIARKPDVIFLDLVMPNTNGYEICAKLRKLQAFQTTPIVILTGKDGIVDRVRAKLVGASDFLNKPIDAGTVLNVISKHLKQGVVGH
ncbi:response regulator receiver domain protein [Coleofasciculus chthonoplastes PCC 7420]|uniref:Response regulator receiver domain protein n=1 Tax=Coleofasciculus chthonoplastes PCC 7420 TaxID=118168 RepID=B4VM49_9CYAN|nr:response regulator [Coleofasciculus chthonoplastes]EDX76829.1 response regulator receiver domain protein [Coleofasciculus chthonoplastes PCC 7420]